MNGALNGYNLGARPSCRLHVCISGRRYIGWCPDPHDESPSYVEIHLQSPKAVHALQFQSTYSGCPDPRHHYDTEAFLATFDLQFVIVGDVERNWVTYDEVSYVHTICKRQWDLHFNIHHESAWKTWPRDYKTFSCSSKLSMKFQLLKKHKTQKNKDFSCFKTLICCIYLANRLLAF